MLRLAAAPTKREAFGVPAPWLRWLGWCVVVVFLKFSDGARIRSRIGHIHSLNKGSHERGGAAEGRVAFIEAVNIVNTVAVKSVAREFPWDSLGAVLTATIFIILTASTKEATKELARPKAAPLLLRWRPTAATFVVAVNRERCHSSQHNICFASQYDSTDCRSDF